MWLIAKKTEKRKNKFLIALMKQKNSGVTILELLIAMSIFVAILSQATVYFRNSSRTNQTLNSKQDALDLVQESLDSIEQNFKKREAIVASDVKSLTLLVRSKEITFESACRATTVATNKTAAIFLTFCAAGCGCASCTGQHVITRSTPTTSRDYPPDAERGLERVKGAVICFFNNPDRLTATVSAAYVGVDGELARVTDERSLSKKNLNTGIQFK